MSFNVFDPKLLSEEKEDLKDYGNKGLEYLLFHYGSDKIDLYESGKS